MKTTSECATGGSPSVLLIAPPYDYRYDGLPFPPLGLLHIAAVLEQRHTRVRVVDLNIIESPVDDFVDQLRADVIGISCRFCEMSNVEQLARRIREANQASTIVLGGPGATDRTYHLLAERGGVDLMIEHEGETAMSMVIEHRMGLEPKNAIPNAIWREGLALRKSTVSCIEEIGQLPMPARHLADMEHYVGMWKTIHGRRTTHMVTSRGCPFACIFCEKRTLGSTFRARSPLQVVDEMEQIRSAYDVEKVIFYDDVFTYDRQRILEMCHILERRRLGIGWVCLSRVDLVDPEILGAMKCAGCEEIEFGVESATDSVLKGLRKGFTVGQAEAAYSACHGAGIKPNAFFMLGIPGQTQEHVNNLRDFIARNRPGKVTLFFFTPYPGTKAESKFGSGDLDPANLDMFDDEKHVFYGGECEVNPRSVFDEITAFCASIGVG